MPICLRTTALFALALASSTCAKRAEQAGLSGQPATPDLHALVGVWALALPVAPDGGPGFRLSLEVDSGRAEVFYGRISHFFSGNVGVDPAGFSPFEGTLSPHGAVDIPVRPASTGGTQLHFAGRLSGDTIRLATLTIGRDTIASPEGRALLIRNP